MDVARIGGPKNPDLDAVVGLDPGLVIADQEENLREDVERLRSAGLPVWVTRIRSLGQALASLRRLFGEAFGVEPAWLGEARREWGRPAAHPGLRVAVPVWRDPWMGTGHLRHDLLADWLGERRTRTGRRRYPGAEVSAVTALRPDLVVLPDERTRSTATARARFPASAPRFFPDAPCSGSDPRWWRLAMR